MGWLARLALVVAAVFVVAGGAIAGYGYYQETTHECGPSHVLYLDQLEPDQSPAATGVPFRELSAEQQRVFRDAYRDERNMTAYTPELDDYVVAYRGERYRAEALHVLCTGPPKAWSRIHRGVALVVVGVVVAVPAVVWRWSARVRGWGG